MSLGLMTLIGLTGIGPGIGKGFTCLRDFGTSFIISGIVVPCCVSPGLGWGAAESATGSIEWIPGANMSFSLPVSRAKPATGLTIANTMISANWYVGNCFIEIKIQVFTIVQQKPVFFKLKTLKPYCS